MVASKAERRAKCAKAFLQFLYEEDAENGKRTSVSGFFDNILSRYNDPDDRRIRPPHYTEEDVMAVVEMLKRRKLIDGIEVAEAGLIAAWLTDDGVDCVERFNGDFQRYLNEQKAGPVSNTTTTTWSFGGDNIQVSTGDNATQSMTINSREEAGLALQWIVELVKEQGLFAGREDELARRQADAVAEFDADQPDVNVIESFLQWVIDSVKQGGTAALVAAVSVMSSDVLHQIANLPS